jgi:hypothetical protein
MNSQKEILDSILVLLPFSHSRSDVRWVSPEVLSYATLPHATGRSLRARHRLIVSPHLMQSHSCPIHTFCNQKKTWCNPRVMRTSLPFDR